MSFLSEHHFNNGNQSIVIREAKPRQYLISTYDVNTNAISIIKDYFPEYPDKLGSWVDDINALAQELVLAGFEYR